MENIEFKIDGTNIEQQKAFDLVANTNTSLFITGKAGTGKTTFVKGIQKQINKNFLLLAPTGIAALNVGGQTIHSFFGLPFEAIDHQTILEVSLEKRIILKYTDTIIIDEASMVRCDWVDGIDRFLRDIMNTHLPFGGKQVVFVGDLFQLPPVVINGSSTAQSLQQMYGSGIPYFYKANVMKRINLPKIEFQKVYRQEDADFLNILNRMRLGENTEEDLSKLNRHVCYNNELGDFSVTLTAYVNIADTINNQKLDDIDSEEFCYIGHINGHFRIQDSPAPMELRLKVGAQVIFCRNDYLHGFANGTIAKVIELDDENIKVSLENGKVINVGKMVWENRISVYNSEKKKVESIVEGSFAQYPLKLAWAITIHKSQGMTFDRMHFDLTRGTFAPGQAYVAISRMRSLEGLTLSNKIRQHHIKQNVEIKAYANSFNDFPMIDEELNFGRLLYIHLKDKDYDNAAKVCLQYAVEKVKAGDYRNAAIIAKRLFDVMFDDECLINATKEIPLLKDCSMTCNFLNAVLCLYSSRYEEAIGYTDMVLDRKACLEAMFIKAKALYRLRRYDEASEVVKQIHVTSSDSCEIISMDKKQYLLEAKLNQHLGTSVIETCQQLMKLCPEYIPAYLMMRNEVLANNQLMENGREEINALIIAFNNKEINDFVFERMLSEADKTKTEFKSFHRKLRSIGKADC